MALLALVRSDLSSQVTVYVTENVYDSPVILQGAKPVGLYDSHAVFYQDRLLLAWTRVIIPNGRSQLLWL